jgi:hypothetical protein
MATSADVLSAAETSKHQPPREAAKPDADGRVKCDAENTRGYRRPAVWRYECVARVVIRDVSPSTGFGTVRARSSGFALPGLRRCCQTDARFRPIDKFSDVSDPSTLRLVSLGADGPSPVGNVRQQRRAASVLFASHFHGHSVHRLTRWLARTRWPVVAADRGQMGRYSRQ